MNIETYLILKIYRRTRLVIWNALKRCFEFVFIICLNTKLNSQQRIKYYLKFHNKHLGLFTEIINIDLFKERTLRKHLIK